MTSSKKMTDSQIHDLAVRLILRIMDSASLDKIRPTDWWSRAQNALYSAATMAQGYGQMVSILGRKLQIDTFTKTTSIEISLIGKEIQTPEVFELFRWLCERDSLYVVAEACALKQLEKNGRNDVN